MRRRSGTKLLVALAVATLLVAVAAWQVSKPLPEGLSAAPPPKPAHDIRFLADYTWADGSGERRTEQEIFDAFFGLIGQAERLVVVDMFLFNGFEGERVEAHRELSEELTEALVRRRLEVPELKAVVITDPFNTLYGGALAPHLEALEAAGVQVVITDLSRLRDPNPGWSAIWRICCQWFGNTHHRGWLPNPVGDDPVTLRTYLALINFKANHRKILVADAGDDWVGLVTSANAHDASSGHGNTAVRFSGPAAVDLLKTEVAIMRISGVEPAFSVPAVPAGEETPVTAQVITEAEVLHALLNAVDGAGPGDELRIAVFYFSHRELLDAVRRAADRGVDVRVLLDPNNDAFGREKSGIPNRQIGMELDRAGITVRWCNTRGEQCHSKLLLLTGPEREANLILGSSNFTRRNLNDYNLETSVLLTGPATEAVFRDAIGFFERRWHNDEGRAFSVPYARYADESRLRYWQYRMMEATGWSTF